MRIVSGPKKSYYLVRVGIFLIMVALILGIAGCGSGQCNLTIHCTEGGWLWEPGRGIFYYDYNTVVHLEAWADTCYEFVNWTGDVGTIAHVENAYTTITMNDSYVITANFVPKAVESVEIWDWYDLDAVRDNLCWNYTLMVDLDSNTPGYEELAGPMANGGRGWEPIGFRDVELEFFFKGTFDGQGHEIHDLFMHGSNPPRFYELALFGLSDGVIENTGVVNATVVGVGALWVATLVGTNLGTVSNSYSSGNVSTDDDYVFIGGLVGENYRGSIINSYSTTSVIGSGRTGGLIGRNFQGTLNNCYSTGNVTGDYVTGGLMGGNFEGTVNNSFWDTESSGQATSAGGTGKTTTEMQDIATFSGAGWDIIEVTLNETNPVYVWNIVNGVTYPFLS